MQKSEANYNMIDWWKKVVFENYANFRGRARRSEYWWFAVANMILLIPFYMLGSVGLATGSTSMQYSGFIIYGLIAMLMIIPGLAVAVRRLHDLNKSGWWYFIIIIPLIGAIILLIWYFTEGTKGSNNYGPDPKNPEELQFDFERQPG